LRPPEQKTSENVVYFQISGRLPFFKAPAALGGNMARKRRNKGLQASPANINSGDTTLIFTTNIKSKKI
jgi:hypothetical protein